MNQRHPIDNIMLDQLHSFQIRITQALVDTLCDREASKVGDSPCLFQEALIRAFYTTLIGVFCTQRSRSIDNVESPSCLPVYLSDELTVQGRVVAIHYQTSTIDIQASIVNQVGLHISQALIKVGMHAE